MNVAIFTEGGRRIGFGHLTRCLALAQALTEQDVAVTFVVAGDESVVSVLPGMDVRLMDWHADPEALTAVDAAAAVIVDSYLAPREFYDRVAQSAATAVYVDDYLRMDYPSGIVLNGSIGAEGLSYPRKEGVSYWLGPSYIPLRRAFWQTPQRTTRPEIRRVLVTFGGSDAQRLTERTAQLLDDHFASWEKILVLGNGFGERPGLRKWMQAQDPLTRCVHAPGDAEMAALMGQCDVVISAGGQTLYECAATGTPVIGIGVADNQRINLRGFTEAKILQPAGWHDEAGLSDALIRCLSQLSSADVRADISCRGRRMVDGQGARRVAAGILDRAGKGTSCRG